MLRYDGHRRPLGDWRAEPATIVATLDGAAVALPDAADVVALGAPAVGADPATAAGLVGEIAMTALGDVLGAARGRPAAELLDLDAPELECELRGHPWIVASKGRVGFGAARPARLRARGGAAGPARLARGRPGDRRRAQRRRPRPRDGRARAGRRGRLGAAARARGARRASIPTRATYLPVHPWQWEHRVLGAATRARSRAASSSRSGRSAARYLPGQSIRTLADADHPRPPPPQARAVDPQHVRLPRAAARPHARRARADAVARPACARPTRSCGRRGLVLLGEVASVSVAHSAFEAIAGVPYQHTELLGAIWREPVAGAPARRRAGDHAGGAHPPRRRRRRRSPSC